MLSEQELLMWVSDLESDRIERTVSTTNSDKFCIAICAFANDFPKHGQPGYLLVGVDDKGQPSGLSITDNLLLNLAAIRSDGLILPLPAMTVQKHTLSDGRGDIVVVTVLPSDLPPVRYRGQVWIRVGPRRAIASETEERLLSKKRTSLARSFDARPCRGCTVQDLSQDLFLVIYRNHAIDPEIIAENHRTLEEQLASLRFYDLNSRCPTFAGTLLFGKNPLEFLPGAYIQFVRYKGKELTDDIQNEYQFSGDLLSVLRELDTFLGVQIQTYPQSDSALHESMVSDYPLVALRELIMNAVMHRVYESNAPIRFYWYTDRVEIQSPGGLYGLATPENFPQQNDYRNPVIAEAMKTLGYVNKYARGVLRAQQALARNGNPPAEFIFQPTYVLAIIRQKTGKVEANS